MKLLRLLCIALMAMLISAAFLACSKSKDDIREVPETKSPVPDPGGESLSVNGTWKGKYYGAVKSIPVYIEFFIKDNSKLEVFNPSKIMIGSGTCKVTGKSFESVYTVLSSGKTYFFKGTINDSPNIISGTWGYGNAGTGDGFWDMSK